MAPVADTKRSFSLILESNISLDFLLPNGLLIPLTLDSELTLEEAKDKLWTCATDLPLFDVLQSKNFYIFCGINRDTAEEEEYYDQTRRLHELPLLLPYLKVIEVVKNSTTLEVNTRDATIASCIGISHTDIIRARRINPEVKWARSRLLRLADVHAKSLRKSNLDGLAHYLMAASQRDLTQSLKATLQEYKYLTIKAWILDGKDPPKKRDLLVQLDKSATVLDALNQILRLQTELALRDCPNPPEFSLPNPYGYVLKVCCCQAYLFEFDQPLLNFEYVQRCIERQQYPCLSPILKRDVYDSLQRSISQYDGSRRGSYACDTWMDQQIRSAIQEVQDNHGDLNGDENYDQFRWHKGRDSNQKPKSTGLNLIFSDDFQALDKLDDQFSAGEEYDDIARDDGDDETRPAIAKPTQSTLPIVPLWKVAGYLSVFVRCGQLVQDSVAITSSSVASGLNQSVASPPVQRSNALSSSNLTLGSTASQSSLLSGNYVVRVGLFHGSQSLIEYQTTNEMPGSCLAWNKWLNFHVYLADIPPAARLCVALIKIERGTDRKSTKTCEYPYGWANRNMFDYRGFMMSDEIKLPLWPASLVQTTEERFHLLHPAGTVLENPNPDLVLTIKIHNPIKARIQKPSLSSFISAYRQSTNSGTVTPFSRPAKLSCTANKDTPTNSGGFTNRVFWTGEVEDEVEECPVDSADSTVTSAMESIPSFLYGREPKQLEAILREIVNRDPLYELCEQEKAALWTGRYFCLHHLPAALPWLTQTVCWYRRDSLKEFYSLVHSWPRPLEVSVALQLLGAMGLTASGASEGVTSLGSVHAVRAGGGASGVADAYVRELAVYSLRSLSDAELSDYLLQLVQSLKAEAYLDNPLSRFMLSRALRSPLQIGLPFFWHLRSEIHLPDMRLRFGVLLEAFCHGCGSLLGFLARQVTALNRLEAISARVKEFSSEEDQRNRFREEIARPEAIHDLQWLPSPLCLNQMLGELQIQLCDVKRSKKRPLWLVWKNSDQLAAHHHLHYQLIFKHGDDLRQDMLTLQLLRVMDRIWKEEGIDMCLMPYGCLATGPEMGLIEVVRDARTVMSIQGERLRAALQIDSTQLYKWLNQHAKQRQTRPNLPHSDLPAYERMIRTFTRSCAGYCVATFILGIRDRHPDNIMVDTNGRLFHIDFGHILDNRKKKFGITRERVPFVLTKDFITVIARGNPDPITGVGGTSGGTGSTAGSHVTPNIYFEEFKQLCGKAYLLLRKRSNLLLTLLAMMLPSGLPELSSVCDLEYVRKTLAVEMTEQQALNYFHDKFNEAHHTAWTTKIDWFSHWVNT